MSSTSTSSARPGARGIQVALALVALVGALFVGSSPASADPAITLYDSLAMEIEGGLVADLDTIDVEGTGFPASGGGTTYYAYVATCNYTLGGHDGSHCNGTTGAWNVGVVDGSGEFSTAITVHESFLDFDFTIFDTLESAGTTVCWLAENWTGLCQVQVSVYDTPFPMGPPVTLATIDLHF